VAGAEREAATLIKEAIAAGGAPDDGGEGLLTVIAIPAEPDLITLRAVQRLQEAEARVRGFASQAEEPVQDVAEAFRHLIDEIRNGYQKLRDLG